MDTVGRGKRESGEREMGKGKGVSETLRSPRRRHASEPWRIEELVRVGGLADVGLEVEELVAFAGGVVARTVAAERELLVLVKVLVERHGHGLAWSGAEELGHLLGRLRAAASVVRHECPFTRLEGAR